MKTTGAGFTTVELLVALSLSFLVAGFVYAAFLFASQLSAAWRQKVALQNAALLCLRPLTDDVTGAARVVKAGATELVLTDDKNNPITYHLENQRLYRNQQPLSSREAQILALIFRYAQMDTSKKTRQNQPTRLVYFHPQHATELAKISLVEIELVLGDGKKQVQIKTAVQPRNARKSIFELM